jgi:hypothetical protein
MPSIRQRASNAVKPRLNALAPRTVLNLSKGGRIEPPSGSVKPFVLRYLGMNGIGAYPVPLRVATSRTFSLGNQTACQLLALVNT